MGLLSLIYADEEKEDEARNLAKECLDSSPDNFNALLARATLDMASQRYENAYSDLQKATTILPESGRAWSSLGLIDFHNFRFEEAESSLLKAVAYIPDHIGSWHILGWIYLMKDNITKAQEAFESAYAIDPTFGESHGALASIYALQGEKQKAEHHIRLAEKLSPDGANQIYANMVLLSNEGKTNEAASLFEEVKKRHNDKLGTSLETLIQLRLAELST